MPGVHGRFLACSWSLCLSERLDALATSKTSDALSFFFRSFYARGFAFQVSGRECGRGKLTEKHSSHFMMPSNLPWKKVPFALPFRVYSVFLASAEIVIVYGSASNNSRVHEIASSGMAWLPQLLTHGLQTHLVPSHSSLIRRTCPLLAG